MMGALHRKKASGSISDGTNEGSSLRSGASSQAGKNRFRVSQRCGIVLCRQGVPRLAKGL